MFALFLFIKNFKHVLSKAQLLCPIKIVRYQTRVNKKLNFFAR